MLADTPEKENVGPEITNAHPKECEEKPPVTTPPATSESNVVPPQSNAHTAKSNKKHWLEWGKFAVGVLTLIVIIAYTLVAYHQWEEMRRATTSADRNFRQDERAWLGLDSDLPIKISVLRTEPPRFEVRANYRIKNLGHGPAFKIASTEWITTDSHEMESWAKWSCQETMNYTKGTLRVGPELLQPPPMGRLLFPEQSLERPINQSAPYVPNIKFIWFIGCITYKDQFNTSHWTRFCLLTPEFTPHVVFDENVPLHFFGMYNDTDDDN